MRLSIPHPLTWQPSAQKQIKIVKMFKPTAGIIRVQNKNTTLRPLTRRLWQTSAQKRIELVETLEPTIEHGEK
ncbi:MAG: hypothetical protein DRO01_05830 [Thermoproteota archaeon]|nr:MAG: hypothetical protein DRO01_05830 [Candidatus Korarchaeota archaeon]